MNQEIINNVNHNTLKPIKKFFKVLGNIMFVILMLIMIILVYFLIKSKVTNQAPSIAGHQMYIVMSGSMNPEFNTGSLVIEKKINPANIKVGDVITFVPSKNAKVTVTHRVVNINKEGKISFTTKGDANKVNDSELTYSEDILGKVIFHIPYIGYLMYFVRTKMGTMLLIIIPGALVVLYEIKNLFDTVKEDEKKKQEKKSQNEN